MNGGKGIAGWVYGFMALSVAVALGVEAADGAAGQDLSLQAASSSAGGGAGAPPTPASEAEADARVQRSAEGYVRDREPNTLHDIMTFQETRSVKRDALRSERRARDSGTKGVSGANAVSGTDATKSASSTKATSSAKATSATKATSSAKATSSTKPTTIGTKSIGGVTGLRSVQYGDHWVYDAGTDLLLDADRDGYYRYLRVHFDVDSYFDSAYVYARLYTSPDGTSWDFYYETDNFLVKGSTPDDAYEVESELLGNYPPDLYDVLVEVYDADTDKLVDEFGPRESSAFSLLPLEDADFDVVTPAPVVVVPDDDGGGGSVSWAVLLALAGAASLRLTRKKSPA